MISESETWTVWKDENGDSLLIVPHEHSDEFAVDDVIEFFTTRHGDIAFRNLSCITLPACKLKRNLNSVHRKLASDMDPLKRVIVTLKNNKLR